MVERHQKIPSPLDNQYDNDKVDDKNIFCFLCVPMRVKEKWVLLSCRMAKRKFDWVLFDQCAHY